MSIAVALYQPEIPGNTGNIIRLCANTNAKLHLIGPCGFQLDDSKLKRAGLDYHEYATMQVHPDWDSFCSSVPLDRLWLCTTKATCPIDHADIKHDDILLFGPETRGLPDGILQDLAFSNRKMRLPMTSTSRSINLSNAVAISVYLTLSRWGFPGLS